MENATVTIPLEEFKKLEELKTKKLTFWDRQIPCPYCKHVNKFKQFDVGIGKGNRFVYCNSDDGGCDKQFIVQTDVVSTLTIRSIAIPNNDLSKTKDMDMGEFLSQYSYKMSARLLNILRSDHQDKNPNFTKVSDIKQRTILKMRNAGKTTWQELHDILVELNFL